MNSSLISKLGENMKILVVCNCNLNRSPTFHRFLGKRFKQHEFKSAGIWFGYPDKLDGNLCDWADKILVMDLEQHRFIDYYYQNQINKVIIMGVSDTYDPDSEELISLIKYWLDKFGNKILCDGGKK